jgi:beta-lactamase class A
MRIPILALLIALPTLPAQTLQANLQSIATTHHGDVALYAENLRTHETVALAPDIVVQTASTIKLAILYEALEQIRAGHLHYDDKITLAPGDAVSGSGMLLFFDAPLNLTFKDILSMMIVVSDNTAANLAMDHVGIANVNARMAKLGLKDTYLYKKVSKPVDPGTVMPDDQKRYGLGKTTARQMAQLITRIVTCDLAEPNAPAQPTDAAICSPALKMLHVQFYRAAIPRFLDSLPGATGDSIANKTGSLDAVRNDIAAVSTKNGLVIISAFTFNNQDHTWGHDQEGEATIAKLAQAIISAWSPNGLAPWPAGAH